MSNGRYWYITNTVTDDEFTDRVQVERDRDKLDGVQSIEPLDCALDRADHAFQKAAEDQLYYDASMIRMPGSGQNHPKSGKHDGI